jgi:hypothetical protein
MLYCPKPRLNCRGDESSPLKEPFDWIDMEIRTVVAPSEVVDS